MGFEFSRSSLSHFKMQLIIKNNITHQIDKNEERKMISLFLSIFKDDAQGLSDIFLMSNRNQMGSL
jgi:hypothetical protein